ncbi:hypothetical protein BDK51DRAFT_39699, partial [Blyttiomyces helicus]
TLAASAYPSLAREALRSGHGLRSVVNATFSADGDGAVDVVTELERRLQALAEELRDTRARLCCADLEVKTLQRQNDPQAERSTKRAKKYLKDKSKASQSAKILCRSDHLADVQESVEFLELVRLLAESCVLADSSAEVHIATEYGDIILSTISKILRLTQTTLSRLITNLPQRLAEVGTDSGVFEAQVDIARAVSGFKELAVRLLAPHALHALATAASIDLAQQAHIAAEETFHCLAGIEAISEEIRARGGVLSKSDSLLRTTTALLELSLRDAPSERAIYAYRACLQLRALLERREAALFLHAEAAVLTAFDGCLVASRADR